MRKRFLALLVLGAVIAPPCPAISADTEDYGCRWGLRIAREASHFRNAGGRLMESLAIRPGMTILDIGTGTGQFALGFAERLRGSGSVFATDIDNSCVNHVQEEARRRGLDILHPVLVTAKGVDEFYGRHTYDLITLMHVSLSSERTAFLARMRNSLAEDGRLAVVVYKEATPFSEQDFAGHFPELVRELSLESPDSPFSRGLGEPTRRLSREHRSGAEPSDSLRKAIVEDFNRMLRNTRFGRDFVDGPALRSDLAFNPTEKDFAEFLLGFILRSRLFERFQEKESRAGIAFVGSFNKLLFLQRFRNCLNGDRLFSPEVPSNFEALHEKAGFRLETKDPDTLPFEIILIFRPDRTGSPS